MATACVTQSRTPDWVEIPAGYRGYLVVQFDTPACPRLERRGESQVIHFGDDGRACTSDRYADQVGVARDRMFYVYPDGQLIELSYDEAGLGTMYGPTPRMSGYVFATPHANPSADRAVASRAWSDVVCWLPLRDAR